jgi:two-component system OmpR family response regulator
VSERILGGAEDEPPHSSPFPAEPPLSGEGRHVLVVEDDEEMRKLLLSHLRRSGFRASGACDGLEMERLLVSAPVDLILLDVMLPGRSGFELCRGLRAQGDMPIIMLTALGETSDRVTGLELGADDFIVKPPEPRELVARIRALLRRSDSREGHVAAARREIAHFASWSLDTRRRELFQPDGVGVDLTGGEYDVLLVFVERPQRILTRDQLLDLARNRPYGGVGRSMDVQVSRLRSKLDFLPGAEARPSLIKTVRNAGYMFTSPVEWSS